jgi:signal transduction histidine kinase/CheY-like chemotaxis protein
VESTISTIEQAEDFIKNLKRSEHWVSDDALFQRLDSTETLIRQHHREDLLSYLGVNFCLFHFDHGDFQKAWHYAEMADLYGEQYENYECQLNGISLQYRIMRQQGKLDKAQEIVNRQIEIAMLCNDAHQIGSAYQNQAYIYHRQKLKADCYEAFERSLHYIRLSANEYYIANFNIGYASVLLDFNEPDKAAPYLEAGTQLAVVRGFDQSLALAYSNYGMLYQMQQKETECVDAFRQCIQLYERLNNFSYSVMAKIMLAEALVNFNRLDEAQQLLEETITISEENKLSYNLIGIYHALSGLMEKKEDYRKALHYLRKLMQAKEDYLNAESEKRIQNLETQQRMNFLRMEKQNAEKMANIKHDFLANMSHEIRTPINSILGICYLLEQQHLNPVQSDYIHRLKRSGENLLGIVNDVLDLSKIESGKMELVHLPFSLHTLIQDIYEAQEPKASDKGLDFTVERNFDQNLIVLGDAVRLYQVLLNLTSNALKFTKEGAVTIHVSTSLADQHHVEIECRISDTGIGIPQDKLDRIFMRYEQASAAIKNTFGGTGLGLSISRKIVELMNGQISVDSRLNEGTTFMVQFRLPLSEAAEQVTDTRTADPALLAGRTILIADDHDENRLVAREILLNFQPDLRIYEATNGQEALELLTEHEVDILFTDLDMPVMNGLELLQHLRQQQRWSNLKIIGNTASLSSLSEKELLALGFDGFLFKPYKSNQLIGIISF